MVEPFVTPENWRDGGVGLRTAETVSRKTAMIDRAERYGRRVLREIIYVVGTPDHIEQIHEEYSFPLFTADEYERAFYLGGFKVDFIDDGLVEGRGMYIGSLA